MKKKLLLKQIVRDFHLTDEFNVKSRDLKLPIRTGKIITLIGVRRSGKTSILYNLINKLTKEIDKTKILYLNFEDERLDLTVEELDLIIQSYQELYPEYNLNDCYFFFDEIQNISGWEKFIRRIYDTISKNIFITGSNSKLLSTDIATSLRGRTITFEVFPLSFKEYLSFKNIEVDFYSTKSLIYIKNAMYDYLQEGGFPEILFLQEEYRIKVLQEYFNVLLYKDLVERYQITNLVALKFFLKRIISSSTKQISINKIYNELKSNGIKIGKNSLYEYLEYAQNIYFAFCLQKFDSSVVNKELGEKKVYSIDIGINNAINFKFNKDIGKSLENAVFLELKRKYDEIYYYRTSKCECDFIVLEKGEVTKTIQVCSDISDEETKKREFKGLIESCKHFNLKEGIIITLEDENEFLIEDILIKIIPFFKNFNYFKSLTKEL